MKTLKVKLTFTEPVLGTSPLNENIYKDYIASKAPNEATGEEELESLSFNEQVEKAMTGFLRTEDGKPMILDYQIKGMFKDSCGMLARLKNGNESSKLKAYKKIIDGLIFPFPREIPFHTDKPIGICQRPLRAQTAQGERIALAMSEQIEAGAWIEFGIKCYDEAHIPAIREWLDYGADRGFGQWRNSGMGRFTWEEIE